MPFPAQLMLIGPLTPGVRPAAHVHYIKSQEDPGHYIA